MVINGSLYLPLTKIQEHCYIIITTTTILIKPNFNALDFDVCILTISYFSDEKPKYILRDADGNILIVS
jgi:hypothetical protein